MSLPSHSGLYRIFCLVGSRRKNISNHPAFLFWGQSNCPQQGARGDKTDSCELHTAPPGGKGCRKQGDEGDGGLVSPAATGFWSEGRRRGSCACSKALLAGP